MELTTIANILFGALLNLLSKRLLEFVKSLLLPHPLVKRMLHWGKVRRSL